MNSTIIALIVSAFFAVILLGGFLVGFWRGFKRSTANLIFSVVGVIVAFFVTPLITNAILGIKVEYEGNLVTLQNVLVEMFLAVGDMRQMISANKNLETLIISLPGAICNVVMFILVTIAIEIVMYIIYKICNFTFLKGPKRGRLFGGLVGLVKAFIVTIIAFMPLAGLIGFANKMTTANQYNLVEIEQTATASEENSEETNKNHSLILDNIPEQAVIVVRGLENNFLTKCSSLFGLDNAMFDYYASAKVDGGRVKIRKEIEDTYQIADFAYQLSYQNFEKLDYTKIDYDKMTGAVDRLTSSNLFKYVLSPTLSDLIVNYEKYSFLGSEFELKDIFKEIGQHLPEADQIGLYFRNDLLNISNLIKNIGKSGIINDVITLEEKNEREIVNALTTEKNMTTIESGINSVFKLNVIQDSISSVMQKIVDKISTELDKIDVDSDDISENGWKEVASSFTQIVKDLGDIMKEVDLTKVKDDPTILLDSKEKYDLNLIVSKFGDMVDQLRANKILQTSEGKPIIDKLLAKHDLALPSKQLIDNNGKKVEIKTYKQLLEFVVQSVITVRDEGVYDIINDNSISDSEKINAIAEILSQENKKDTLNKIILPLYQVEFTNKNLVQKFVENLNPEILDLKLLNNYDEWKSDLKNISDIFVALNSHKVDDTTYLMLIVDGEMERLINNIKENEIDEIFNPLLSAKSTKAIKDNIFEILGSSLSTLTGKEITMSTEGVSFAGEESQTEEICNILKKFVAISNNVGDGIANIDRQSLAELLEAMKVNAYRTSNGKSEEGIFKNCYEVIVESFNEVYNEVITVIANDNALLNELGVEELTLETLLTIDFNKLIEMIENKLA